MRAWLTGLPVQAKTVLALGFLTVGLLFFLVFLPLFAWNIDSAQRIEQAQPRIGRLMGFEGSTEALERALSASQREIDSFLHRRQAGEASVGSAAQRQLRQLAENAGLTIQGSQVMEPVGDEELIDTRVGVDLRGDLAAVELLLDSLDRERPFLLPREIRLAPIRARRGQAPSQTVAIKLVVSAFSRSVEVAAS